jgi:hypothetical protein
MGGQQQRYRPAGSPHHRRLDRRAYVAGQQSALPTVIHQQHA